MNEKLVLPGDPALEAHRERAKRLNLEYLFLVRDMACDPGASAVLGLPDETIRLIGRADRRAIARLGGRGIPLIVARARSSAFWERAFEASDGEFAVLLAQAILGGGE